MLSQLSAGWPACQVIKQSGRAGRVVQRQKSSVVEEGEAGTVYSPFEAH